MARLFFKKIGHFLNPEKLPKMFSVLTKWRNLPNLVTLASETNGGDVAMNSRTAFVRLYNEMKTTNPSIESRRSLGNRNYDSFSRCTYFDAWQVSIKKMTDTNKFMH